MLGTLHIDVCAELQDQIYVYRGTFVVTSSRGATLSGTATGTTDLQDFPPIFSLTLQVEKGTSSFKNVTGHIDLSGTWGATVAGTSTGHLHGPK
jgi:hypothetical protein